MNMEREATPGEKIAFRDDGAAVVYDHNDGTMDWGYILMPDGMKTQPQPLVSILVRSNWSKDI